MNKVQKNLRKWAKWRRRRGSRPADVKGRESEDRFERMTLALLDGKRLPWMFEVRKASQYADVFEKTDFRIHARGKNGETHLLFWISVQIKSSNAAAHEFMDKYPKSKVHLVVMNHLMDMHRLQERLEQIYEIELERINKPAFMVA